MDIIKVKGNKLIIRRPDGTKRVVTEPEGETKTQIQFQKDCNVNNIIAKFKKTGSVTHVRNKAAGVYADLSELPSLQEAHATVNRAEEAFAAVPSQIRARFGNSAEAFVNFLKDSSNDEEAIKLGLKMRKPQAPQPNEQTKTNETAKA